MNDIDIEEYNKNIIQELNEAEEEGELSLSMFLHDLIEIDIESNFTYNYKVIDRIINICIKSLNNHLIILSDECMYFVRYCINKCINIKEEINEQFFKNLNIILNVFLNEKYFLKDTFLLFERTFFFFILDLNNNINIMDIWKNYDKELANFYTSLLHILSYHLSLMNQSINNLKNQNLNSSSIQIGCSRIKIIEIGFDVLLFIFKSIDQINLVEQIGKETCLNLSNTIVIPDHIENIINQFELIPDIEIKKKILSLFKIMHKRISENINLSLQDNINNLINKKITYYLTLTKEKNINIDTLKESSYIYVSNNNLFLSTFNTISDIETDQNDKTILSAKGYKGNLLLNFFYVYFYNTQNQLLIVLSYDRIKIKTDQNSKTIIFQFKRADALGVISNRIRKQFEDRLLENVEISIKFNTESVKDKIYDIINNLSAIENVSYDDMKSERHTLEDVNADKPTDESNNILGEPQNQILAEDIYFNCIEKLERRKVSFATTKEICLLKGNVSMGKKTMPLNMSINYMDCKNDENIRDSDTSSSTNQSCDNYNDEYVENDKKENIQKESEENIDENNISDHMEESNIFEENEESDTEMLKVSFATTKDYIIKQGENEKDEEICIYENNRENLDNYNNEYNLKDSNGKIQNECKVENASYVKSPNKIKDGSIEKIVPQNDLNREVYNNNNNDGFNLFSENNAKKCDSIIYVTNSEQINLANKEGENNNGNVENCENFKEEIIGCENKIGLKKNKRKNYFNNTQCNQIKSPAEIIKTLLNYDEKQEKLTECIQSLSKYKRRNRGYAQNIRTKDEVIDEEVKSDAHKESEKSNMINLQELCKNGESGSVNENKKIYLNTNISETKDCSEIVNIIGKDEPSNETLSNNDVENVNKDRLSPNHYIDKPCSSSKSKKRITTNTSYDIKSNSFFKNNIDSPYPIKKVKYNYYDPEFLDILKKGDNLENLSAKYLIKAYTLMQYNKRYIHIQIIDYFRYIRQKILLSYENINLKYKNLLKEIQSEYDIRFQSIISKHSKQLLEHNKKKTINITNMPNPIDTNIIKEKLKGLYDTFNVVQRTIKDKVLNSKILLKYKQSDIYTPSFSLGTIVSKCSS
ncbi:conserved Plasmodium protein, unknown function [Plasmodium vinckei vinckei]|uniref:Uncharacterized protein n=1 Tax=Plasmodium vinckei vinckei TaxID=54757 RepID=A0A449BSA2_PLAVN|nr:conserved Plasmodium protein, unknown function [Plasmodium vinckei vinckei]KEG02033.1 hypothetical protein YYE_02772 [Plasmodium vinckei vinckei]VEV56273.1 conserved Plasmodium protein, unknown function [Plasmodium vinckei vinckei]